jgi:polysaccharide export outer membrane protein
MKALTGIGLAILCSGFMASAQSQNPPNQTPPNQTPPPASAPLISSPAVIIPPAQAVPPASPQAETKPQDKAEAPKGKGNRVDPSAVPGKDPTAVGPTYIIGPEDGLYIRVWKNLELSGSVTVGPDGTISMQLIDEVKAAGLTPRQLEEDLEKRLKQFIVEPQVNVQVTAVRSRTYIILGDGVARPGIYGFVRPLTVLEALIAGGSFSPFAKKNKIYVMRGDQKFAFNWNEVSKGKNMKQNIIIQNGDRIYVP